MSYVFKPYAIASDGTRFGFAMPIRPLTDGEITGGSDITLTPFAGMMYYVDEGAHNFIDVQSWQRYYFKGSLAWLEVDIYNYSSNSKRWRLYEYAGGWADSVCEFSYSNRSLYTEVYFTLAIDEENERAQFGRIWFYKGGQAQYRRVGGDNDGRRHQLYLDLKNGGALDPIVPPQPSDEPYGDDSYDTSSGGDGGHDDTSDTISESALPIMYASNSGMCTAWVPNIGEIRAVAKALVDPNVAQAIWQSVAKLSDVIIGLSLFPCNVDQEQTPQNVKVNFMGVHINTGVECHLAADQFEEIDCGTLDIDEFWGNCLDYNPYTRISIYLPFCGMYELDVDEVMGKTIGVSYRIDILSGACLATIKIDGSVFYQYTGQCSAQVPLSSVSFDQFLSSAIELGLATATGVGAVGAAGAAAQQADRSFMNAPAGHQSRAALEDTQHAEAVYTKVKEQTTNSLVDATVGAVMGCKGFYQHAGALSASPGFLAVKKPFLIIKRPEQLIPGMYGKFHGFPCNTTAVLGDLVGYTEIGDIRLNIPEATVDEIIECEQLLKGGVVI